MSVRLDPGAVPAELVALTRRLGAPERNLVLLGEGNTSTVLAGGELVIKRSGARMQLAGVDDFAVLDPRPLVELLEDPGGSQEGLGAALAVDSGPARASIETLVHVAAVTYGGARWVAHTHPTWVVGLLSATLAEELWCGPLFPDEAVILGMPAWVPYREPGLELGRAVAAAIQDRDGSGQPLRLLLLANHGIVAFGETAAEVEAVTEMCVKAAQVRAVALACGGFGTLAPEQAAIADRGDEVIRREHLFEAGLGGEDAA